MLGLSYSNPLSKEQHGPQQRSVNQPTSQRPLSALPGGVKAQEQTWDTMVGCPAQGTLSMSQPQCHPAGQPWPGHQTVRSLGFPTCKMGLHLPLGVMAQTWLTSQRLVGPKQKKGPFQVDKIVYKEVSHPFNETGRARGQEQTACGLGVPLRVCGPS